MKKFLKSFVLVVLLLCTFSLFGCDLKAKSAYDIAVEHGFVGSETEWLESLKGEKGEAGVNSDGNAYDLAVKEGFKGTVTEWLASLRGASGVDGKDGELTAKSLFETAVEFKIYEDTSEGYKEFLNDYFLTYGDTLVKQVSAKCVNQVVTIFCPVSSGLQMGSGVIYAINKNDAYIMTNYHVIALSSSTANGGYTPATKIYCYLYGRETITQDDDGYQKGESGIEATYIGGSAEYDLAVLRVTGESFDIIKNSSAMAVTFANSDEVQVGENAIAIGNPSGGGMAVTSGVISQTSERVSVSIAGEYRTLRCFRVDTAVNRGNSGGGLFDSKGNFLGIVNAKIESSYIDNIANAICSNNVKNVVENVIYNYTHDNDSGASVGVKKVSIGITYTASDKNNVYNEETFTNKITDTALIVEVTSGSLAEQMGLKVDDKIVGMSVTRGDAEKTTRFDRTFEQLGDFVLTLREGDTIKFVIKSKTDSGYSDEKCSGSVTLTSKNFKISKDNARSQTSTASATNSSSIA